MTKHATCLQMSPRTLWMLAPIIFSKEYAIEVGEAPVFDFSSDIVVFAVVVDDGMVSFCIDEHDGSTHNWRYDYTIPECRGEGLNKICFSARNDYCKNQPCYIEVRQERESMLAQHGFKTIKQRGQWRFMRRD